MQIAIMGFGTIGSGVAELLLKNQKSIVAKSGQASLEVKHILDIRDFKGHELESCFTKDFNDILNDPEVGLVVETMGGLHPAYEYVCEALRAGKHVVTANKWLMCEYYQELVQLAKETVK